MKRIVFLLALVLCLPSVLKAQWQEDSLAIVNANWNWEDLRKGAKAGYALIPMFGDKQSIAVIKYPAKKFKTVIIDAQSPNQATTPVIAKRENALAAINASYFDVRKLIPSTYFALNGKRVGETYKNELFRVNGYVAVKNKKGTKIEIAYMDTTKYDWYPKHYKALLSSGPIVLLDGNIPTFPHDKGFYDHRHPRTVMGYDNDGNVYFVVIDGRFPNEGAFGATISEVALISRFLGMTYAINLDGGGSSTAWTEKTGVINHPFDNKKFDHEGCRKVPNVIIMK